MPLSTRKAFAITFFCLLAACAKSGHTEPTPGLQAAPKPPIAWPTPDPLLIKRMNAVHACGTGAATAAIVLGGSVYAGCNDGRVLRLDDHMRVIRWAKFAQSQISVRHAGDSVLAVEWVDDGAALVNRLLFLSARTLKPLNNTPISDGTFLGTIGNRIYVDDWCCNGRADVYQPATLEMFSLKDGRLLDRVDLAPDRQAHPGADQPLGQGELNYLIGKYFYVVVGDITYRYDITDFTPRPVRMKTYEAPR